MPKRRKHWIIKRLADLREQSRGISFSSGTTRRRRDLIELISAINDCRREFPWGDSFLLSVSDNGSTGKIILTPAHIFNKGHGKIIIEYPSTHNTHRTAFIFAETKTGIDVAHTLRKLLARRTIAFEFPLIMKQGRKLIPVDPG